MEKNKDPLAAYSKFSIILSPTNLLSGNADSREGEIALVGKKSDDLNGGVRRRLLLDINRYFWEHPKGVDDTQLVFEAEEKEAKYSEDKDGTAKLILKIKIELAANRPGDCCC